jgi:hypothetical protein
MVFAIFPALAKEKLKGLLELGHFYEVARALRTVRSLRILILVT